MMAGSPSHALGQIAGYMAEQAFFDMLLPVANEYSLFVDRQGPRRVRGKKKKVTWTDDHDNRHDLDFVFERNGSQDVVGAPAAFIESAWRRYTKHSMNKAGELANALIPLRRTYSSDRPFLGAILTGEWTPGAITQLESQGINTLHLPVSSLVQSFAVEDIDFEVYEHTPDDHMAVQVAKWGSIGSVGQEHVIRALREVAREPFEEFVERMREHLSRKVQRIRILPLHGNAQFTSTVAEAISILSTIDWEAPPSEDLKLIRIEIRVEYSDDDCIEASFNKLSNAINWLELNHLHE